MEFKGTPGKWQVDTSGYKTQNGGICIMDLNQYQDYNECIAVVGDGNPHQPIEANALLISKAPELLEKLKSLVSHYEDVLKGDFSAMALRSEIDSAKELMKKATEI